MAAKKKRVLGRGLGNLMENVPAEEATGLREIDIEKIRVNPDNPRKKFDTTSIKELANTIKTHGLLQPILVREKSGEFIVISGERRLRACRLLKMKTVPCVLKEVDEKTNIEVSLIENIQREQLDPIEESTVYEKLMKEYGYTQQQLAERVGKDRSTVANRLRLLTLPDVIQTAVADGRLSEGHVRPLLGIKNSKIQNSLAREIMVKGLNARQIEELVRKYKGKPESPKSNKKKSGKSNEIKKLEKDLEATLKTRVTISHNDARKSGKIVLEYFDLDELDRILRLLKVKR